MPGDLLFAAAVVEATLLASVCAAHRDAVGLVEVGDGLVVLALPVLNHEPDRRVVGVDRQAYDPAARARVADEPVEAVLAQRRFADDLVAQVDDIRLVAVASRPRADASSVDPRWRESFSRQAEASRAAATCSDVSDH